MPSSSLKSFYFLPALRPRLIFIVNFDARHLMTSLFLLGLFGREFSTLLSVLDLMAELLKDDVNASGKNNGCCACGWLMIFFLLGSSFLSLSFFLYCLSAFNFNRAYFFRDASFTFYPSAFFSLLRLQVLVVFVFFHHRQTVAPDR